MESKDDPVPDGPPDNISYPTTNDFYFAWSEMMTSDWNRRALAVTYSRLLEKFDDDDLLAHHDEDTIRKKVRKHAEYLKSVWIREHNYTEEDLENYNRSRSDYTRRRGVSSFAFFNCLLALYFVLIRSSFVAWIHANGTPDSGSTPLCTKGWAPVA